MSAKVLIAVDAKHAATVRQAVALTAPHGTVFDVCAGAVITQGRDLPTQLLAAAVARRVAAAEKKGRRGASAPAVG